MTQYLIKCVFTGLILLALPAPCLADITSGLVGWWKLDEGGGNSTADSSGNGNTGDLTGHAPTWVAGRKGQALNFVGSTYVNIGDVSPLQ